MNDPIYQAYQQLSILPQFSDYRIGYRNHPNHPELYQVAVVHRRTAKSQSGRVGVGLTAKDYASIFIELLKELEGAHQHPVRHQRSFTGLERPADS